MQGEKTAAQICADAADHIEANGLLFDGWESEDGTKDLPPCCCVVGTMRFVAGLPPGPGLDEMLAIEGTPLFEAVEAVGLQTLQERHGLTDKYHSPDSLSLYDLGDWSNHFADVEVVCRKRRNGLLEYRRLEHEDGDRHHVVAVLRRTALRCAGSPERTRNSNCLEGIRCPKCGQEDSFRIEGRSVFEVIDDGTVSHADVEWDDDSWALCPACEYEGKLGTFRA